MAENRYAPLMDEVVVTGKRGGRRSDPRHYVPEAPKDSIGINIEDVTSQLKTTIWDVLQKSITGYLSGNEYSGETFKNIISQQSLSVPINLPGGYGIDLDFNRPMPSGNIGDPRDKARITLRKKIKGI